MKFYQPGLYLCNKFIQFFHCHVWCTAFDFFTLRQCQGDTAPNHAKQGQILFKQTRIDKTKLFQTNQICSRIQYLDNADSCIEVCEPGT